MGLTKGTRKLVWAAVIAAVLAILFVAYSCGTGETPRVTPTASPSASPSAGGPRDIGESVTAEGPSLPVGLKAAQAAGVTAPFKQVTKLTPVLEITPPGETPSLKLSFTTDQPVPADNTVVVATAESAKGPWTLIRPAAISEDGRTVTVVTDHLSFWQVLKANVEDALDELNDALIKGITSNLTANATAPKCKQEDAARSDGYEISSSAKKTLYWCFGIEGGQRVLKVVNRMRYPLEIKYSGLEPINKGPFQLKLDQLAKLGPGDPVVLRAFEEAVFKLSLKPGGTARIDTVYSGYAQSLGQLELGISLAGSILTRFGAGEGIVANGAISKTGFDLVAKYTDKFLLIKDCAQAFLDRDPGEVIKSCFSPEAVMEAFGWKGLLLAPVMAASSVVEYFRSAFSALIDQFTANAEYKITVSRSEKFDLGWLAGEWKSCPDSAYPDRPIGYLYTSTKGEAQWVEGKTVRIIKLTREGSEFRGKITESRRGTDLTGLDVRFRQISDGGIQMAGEGLYVDFYRPSSPLAQCG